MKKKKKKPFDVSLLGAAPLVPGLSTLPSFIHPETETGLDDLYGKVLYIGRAPSIDLPRKSIFGYGLEQLYEDYVVKYVTDPAQETTPTPNPESMWLPNDLMDVIFGLTFAGAPYAVGAYYYPKVLPILGTSSPDTPLFFAGVGTSNAIQASGPETARIGLYSLYWLKMKAEEAFSSGVLPI